MTEKILIVGAGIGGLTTALRCRQLGFDVEVFERAPGPEAIGAGLQISPNASRILQALDLEETLAPHVSTPQNAIFSHYRSGDPLLTIALGATIANRYGAPYWHIHRADLASCLTTAATQKNVRIHYGHNINQIVNNDAQVSVKDNKNNEFEGSILVVSDGVHAHLRASISDQTSVQFTGQKAWRGCIPSAALPAPPSPDVRAFLGPDKHFVTYPIRQGGLLNFIAITETNDWTEDGWRQAGDVKELRHCFAGWNVDVENILKRTESCQVWGLLERPMPAQWSHGRATLLGDACHAMLPFLAQGAAMAIEDAYVLGSMLAQYGAQPEALRQFQIARYARVKRVQRRAQRNAALYHAKTPASRLSQSVILTMIGKLQSTAIDPLNWLYSYDPVTSSR